MTVASFVATVEDLASRRIVGFGISEHHDAELATGALKMAVAVRGGDPPAPSSTPTVAAGIHRHPVRAALQDAADQPIDGPGRDRRFDNAAAESWFSTLEWELFRHRHFETKQDARHEVARFIDGQTRVRRHSLRAMKPPIAFEAILATRAAETVPAEEAA